MTGGALLVLLRKGLHSGFDRMFHLLHHLFWIEGYTGTRLVDVGATGVGGSDTWDVE